MFEDSFFLIDDNRALFFYPNLSADARYKIDLPETLTDIALAPSGDLYGISTTTLYRIDIGSSDVDRIATHTLGGANALEIDPDGNAYTASSFVSGLHSIDLSSGETQRIGDGDYFSAGDLLFTTDGTLLLSTIDAGLNLENGTIAVLDPANGVELLAVSHQLPSLFGFAEIDDDIIAFSLDDAHVVDFADGVTLFERSFSADGVTTVNGATGALSYDTTRSATPDQAQTVAYLYEAALNRNGNIDESGLNFWIDVRESGFTEEEIAAEFLRSPEFANSFGNPDTLSDTELVERLYLNVLDRPSEPAGFDFWVDTVGLEEFGRDDLLLAFARSPENLNGSEFVESLSEISPGYWDFA